MGVIRRLLINVFGIGVAHNTNRPLVANDMGVQ